MVDIESIEDYLLHGVWVQEWKDVTRVTRASLKINPGGFLLVICAISGEGPKVTFVGGESIKRVVTKLKNGAREGTLKWRADKYAFDEK